MAQQDFDPTTATPVDAGGFDPATAQPVKASGFMRRAVADPALALAKGVIGVPEAAVGIADIATGGRAGKVAEGLGFRPREARQMLTEMQSPELQAARERVAEAKGFFPTVAAAVQNPSTIADTAVESVPSIGLGGVIGRGALAVAPRIGAAAAGAIGEGAISAGQTAEQVRQEDPNGTLTAQQGAIAAGSGALTGAIGFGAGRLANRLGIGDVDTALVRGKTGAVGAPAQAKGAEKGIPRKIAEGFGTEGVLEELPQSYTEQMAQNLMQGKPATEGAAEAAAQGMLAGGITGGIVAPLHGKPEKSATDPNAAAGPTTNPGAAPERRTYVTDPSDALLDAPKLSTSLGAGVPRDGVDFTRDVPTDGLSLVDPAEEARARAATIDFAPADATPAWDTAPGAAPAQATQDGLTPPAPEFDTGSLAIAQPPLALPPPTVTVDAQGNAVAPGQRPPVAQPEPMPLETGRFGMGRNSESTPAPAIGGGVQDLLTGQQDPLQAALRQRIARGEDHLAAEVDQRAQRGAQLDAIQTAAAGENLTAEGRGERTRAAAAAADLPGGTAMAAAMQRARTRSEAMGLRADAGPLSAAAVVAVDGGAHDANKQKSATAEGTFTNPLQAQRALRQSGQPGQVVRADGGWTIKRDAPQQPAQQPAAAPAPATAAQPAAPADGLRPFPANIGSLGVTRAEMPQITPSTHGPLTQFMAARGIGHETGTVDPAQLKPTQAEYDPAKVRSQRDEGVARTVLISSDGYVLDGTHQWLSRHTDGQPIKVIKFDAPIAQLLPLAKEFPSAATAATETKPAGGETNATPAETQPAKQQPAAAPDAKPAPQGEAAAGPRAPGRANRPAAGGAGGEQPAAVAAPAGRKPLSVGTTPQTAEPVTVRDGIVHVGKYEAVDYDSGEPIKVPAGASDEDVRQALQKAGALPAKAKFFGGEKAPAAVERAAAAESGQPAPVEQQKQLYVLRGAERFPVDSLEDAAAKWAEFRSRAGAGASELGNGTRIVDQDGKDVARIAFNGKVFPPGDWKPGTKPLVQPAPAPAGKTTKSPLRSFLREVGVKSTPKMMSMLTGEKSPFRAHSRLPKTFRPDGLNIDKLVEAARERGFLPREGDDIDHGNMLAEMVQAELRGQKVEPTLDGSAEERMAAEVERRRQQAADDAARAFELTPDELEETGFPAADAALQARVQKLVAEAEAAGLDVEGILEDVAKRDQNATQDEYHAAAVTEVQAALASARGEGARDRGESPGGASTEAPREVAAEGLTTPRPAQDLLGDIPNTSQQEAARLRAEREDQQRRQAAQAPSEGEFTLTGSTRAADDGAARGQGDLLAEKAKALDHGELNIPGRLNSIDAELDRFKKEQAKQQRADAKVKSAARIADKARARKLFDELWPAMKEKMGEKFGEKELRDTLNSMVKWEPAKFIALAEKFQREQGEGDAMFSRGTAGLKQRVLDAAFSEPTSQKNLVRIEGNGLLAGKYVTKKAEAAVFVTDKVFGRAEYMQARKEAEAAGIDPNRMYVYAKLGSYLPNGVTFTKLEDVIDTGPEQGTLFKRGDTTVGPQLRLREIDRQVSEITRDWLRKPDIHVIASMDEAPEAVRKVWEAQNSQGAVGGIEGFHWRGEVYLVADSLVTPEDVRRVLFHESLGHFGLRGVFGDRLNWVLDEIVANRPQLIARKAQQYGLDLKNENERRMAAEEVLAEMAQERPELGWVRRAVAVIRQWLRQHGIRMGLSDADIVANYLAPARGFVERGRSQAPSFADARPAFSAADRTDTAAFRKWFGDSKVVDADGKPLVVYHGTNKDFEAFDTQRGGELGSHFGTADQANKVTQYWEAKRKPAGNRVLPVYLSIKKPLRLKDYGHFGRQAVGVQLVTLGILEKPAESIDDTVAAIKAAGYDGVVYENKREGEGDSWIAFSPEQIKSAIGNNGDFDPANPDIAFSRSAVHENTFGQLTPEQERALKNVGGIQPKQTVAERFAALRANLGLKVVQGLFDQFAPIKSIGQKEYMLARMSKAAEGTMEAALLYGKPFLRDGVADVDIRDGGFAKVLASLKGEHDRFLWWVAAQRAERLKAEGRENLFTDADISHLKTLDAGTFADGAPRAAAYAAALRELTAYNEAALKLAMQSGLIDQDAFDAMRSDPYIPFYRLLEDGDELPKFRGGSGLVNQEAFKKLKGGKDKLNTDLLQNLLLNWSHLYAAAAKNRAAKATVDAAVNMAIAYPAPAGGKGTVKVKEDGRDVAYRIEDPYLLEAITSLNYVPSPLIKPLAAFKNLLTLGVTANPAFKIRNIMRDSIAAVAQADLSYNPFENVAKGWKSTSRDSQTFASMLAAGGVMRFGSQEDTSRVRKQIDALGGEVLDDTGWRKLTSQMSELWHAYQEFGDRGENVNRAALYEKLVAQGKTHAEAAFMARDLMDFSMGGQWGAVRFLAQTVPFLNARLVGLQRLGQAAKEDPKRFVAVTGAVMLASLALLGAYHDDDDWRRREDWDRDAYWWFKIGGVAFRIPKPFEIGALGTLAERTAELMFSDEMTAKRFNERLSAMLFQTFNFDPTPQAFKPVLDVYANKDSFTGRPIEGMSDERLRPKDRAGTHTSEIARFLGKLGMPDPAQLAKGQYAPLSPKQVDFLLRGYFGWFGTVAQTVSDYAIRPLTDRGAQPAMQMRDVFLAGNFVEALPTGSSRYVTAMYEQAKEVEQAYASYRAALKSGDTEKALEILQEEGPKIRSFQQVVRIKRAESLITAQIRRIEESRDLSATEKRDQIAVLQRRKELIARPLTGGSAQ